MKKYCLLSVTDKSNLDFVGNNLVDLGYEILSTGGTAEFLKSRGIKYTSVSDYTGQKEIMDGRVKTLHPKIHGGILARDYNQQDLLALKDLEAGLIEVVIVNLYPFLYALSDKNKTQAEMTELIDIGGPSMLRSAAKNFERVYSVIDPGDYSLLIDKLKQKSPDSSSLEFRKYLSAKVFANTALYDLSIASYLSRSSQESSEALPKYTGVVLENICNLRYGENPHQNAAWYAPLLSTQDVKKNLEVRQGKELSYNNLNDSLAASDLMLDFKTLFEAKKSAVIIKHANPCGVAVEATLLDAFKKAVSCDPVSAFGGIICLSDECTFEIADEINKTFFEVVIAPSYTKEALEKLANKKNLRVIVLNFEALSESRRNELQFKSIVNSFLVQEQDDLSLKLDDVDWKVGASYESIQEKEDAELAFLVSKHVKSNAIVIAKNGMAIGVGAGQMNRVDSSRIAIHRAQSNNHQVRGAVVASDAFLPFRDNVDVFSEAGISLIVQPGGSIRDDEVVSAVSEKGMRMIFTGKRFFRH